MKATTIRGANWLKISERVLAHIENYTVPQYRDAPNDAIEGWGIEECFKQVERYLARRNTSMRPKEKALDILKSINYLSLALEKMEKEPPEEEKKIFVLNLDEFFTSIYNNSAHNIVIKEFSKDKAKEILLTMLDNHIRDNLHETTYK